MAIVFAKQKKTQRNLAIAFVFLIVIALAILWQGLLREETVIFIEETHISPQKDVEIDFDIFDHPKIKELVPFVEIEPFAEVAPTEDSPGETIGRENPFIFQ